MPYKNRADQLQRYRRYYQENKEKISKRYRAKRDEIALKRKAYYQRTRHTRLQQAKDYRANNLQERRAYDMAYNKRRSIARKDYALRRAYGISLSVFHDMLIAQQHRCANTACHRKHTSKKPLVVDHNHSTGRVRGLLCTQCNCAFGYARESRDVLMGLIEYGVTNEGEWYQGRPINMDDTADAALASDQLHLLNNNATEMQDAA